MTFTREQINSIKVGATKIASFWQSEPTEVVSIHAKQDDIHGKLFVCGYHKHGSNGIVSFSVKEGDATDAKFTRIVND